MKRDSEALSAPENCQRPSVKPLVFDIFCGLGGWSESFIEEGYRTVGIDIEAHDYGNGCYPGELLVRDVRSVTGSELVKQYGAPTCIVASPPCQEFSYMAMPWTKAKEKMRKILADPAEQVRLCDLFNQCFRIQREVSEAAGHYIPMVIENVRGAQRWVGRAQWNFGSFYLWGDVPALMPSPSKKILKYGMICAQELKAKNGTSKIALRDGPAEGFKTSGMNWSDQSKRGQDFTRIAGKQALGTKCGGGWFGAGNDTSLMRQHSSKSPKRKEASALIAKIPKPLAQWIAQCFKPKS